MWAAGIVDEARGLLSAGIENGVTASRAIGYAQALGQVHGTLSQAEAIEATQQLTRRYARRQVSWFKRYAHTHWIESDTADRVDDALALVDRDALTAEYPATAP
jgi:tRNA dimethylallyltransferase